jgi:hypothetical protein
MMRMTMIQKPKERGPLYGGKAQIVFGKLIPPKPGKGPNEEQTASRTGQSATQAKQ